MDQKDLLNLRPIPTKGTILRKENFGAMLASGNLPILSLNEDALAIWNLCDGSRTVAEIVKQLTEIYEGEYLRERLFEFLQYGLANGLLEDKSI